MTHHEPKVHPLIKNSFAFVPTAEWRAAPEILVLELMREVFFDKHYENTMGRELSPDKFDDKSERAVLFAFQGRRKEHIKKRMQKYFAPAYPKLSEQGWLGEKRARVINNFLLSGPIAQHLWYKGPGSEDGKNEQKILTEKIWKALLGNNSYIESGGKKDILAATLGPNKFSDFIEKEKHELSLQNLRTKTGHSSKLMRIAEDELADRITKDFSEISDLEARLPRMQWIQLLMTFLRFSLPMWLLAQMKITKLLHQWLLEAIDDDRITGINEIKQRLAERNRNLLYPILTPTRQLYSHIDDYMKCRVELNILLEDLEKYQPEIKDQELTLDGNTNRELSVDRLLELAKKNLKSKPGALNIRTRIMRKGENFSAWRTPRKRGRQGNNINEFFHVLYKAETGDESGGYLLIPEGRHKQRGFRVFPGQLLLKTVTYLAARNKVADRQAQGKLVLQDVEEHFKEYGIDFCTSADARPLLMKELQEIGLLAGSPDAGSSVAVTSPYR